MENRILKYLRYGPQKQMVVILAFAVQLGVRMALYVVPFYRILRFLNRLQSMDLHGGKADFMKRLGPMDATPDVLAWAVQSTSRFVPGSKCLCQAITGQILMSLNGLSTELRIGVQKLDTEPLSAHAWLIQQGKVLIGNLPNLADYVPLPSLPGGPR
jgi:hypothetical protein